MGIFNYPLGNRLKRVQEEIRLDSLNVFSCLPFKIIIAWGVPQLRGSSKTLKKPSPLF